MMEQATLDWVSELLAPALAAGDAAAGAGAWERDRENVVRIGRMVHTFSRRRFDELREHVAPDVEYEMAGPENIAWRRRAQRFTVGADGRLAGFRSVVGAVGRRAAV